MMALKKERLEGGEKAFGILQIKIIYLTLDEGERVCRLMTLNHFSNFKSDIEILNIRATLSQETKLSFFVLFFAWRFRWC